MEVFIHDKTKKAYYVFPLGYTPVSAINDVAKEKHINPDRLEAWDLVRKEIREALFFDDKETVLKVIDKHLKGVED